MKAGSVKSCDDIVSKLFTSGTGYLSTQGKQWERVSKCINEACSIFPFIQRQSDCLMHVPLLRSESVQSGELFEVLDKHPDGILLPQLLRGTPANLRLVNQFIRSGDILVWQKSTKCNPNNLSQQYVVSVSRRELFRLPLADYTVPQPGVLLQKVDPRATQLLECLIDTGDYIFSPASVGFVQKLKPTVFQVTKDPLVTQTKGLTSRKTKKPTPSCLTKASSEIVCKLGFSAALRELFTVALAQQPADFCHFQSQCGSAGIVLPRILERPKPLAKAPIKRKRSSNANITNSSSISTTKCRQSNPSSSAARITQRIYGPQRRRKQPPA